MSLAALPFELPPALERALRDAYAEPPRAYHSFAHVGEVLARYAEVPRWDAPVEVALAVLFHDAVYVAGRTDNETKSAALARAWIPAHLPALGADVGRVVALVLLTAAHGKLAPGDPRVDHDAALFLDCDMAILGADPERFDAYERAIAAEYATLPRLVYAAGRRRFLGRLLASPAIYLSPFFRDRLEANARANLRRALGRG